MFKTPLRLMLSDKKNQEILIFALIISLASYLRFYLLPYNMPFIGDQAKDYFSALAIVEEGKIPLLGIESSMPQFRQGPVYIWLLGIFFAVFGTNPENTSYLAASLGVLAVGALHIYTRKYFGRKTSLIATAILAASPLAVAHSQLAFVINPIPLVSVMYLVSLFKYQVKKSMSLFWPALICGFLFQFELASAPLFTLLVIAYLQKHPITEIKTHVVPLIKGLIAGLLPQIAYDLTHQFRQLGLFSAWVAYRILGFFGLKGEHTTSISKLFDTTDIFKTYFHKFISWDNNYIFAIFLILLIGGFLSWLSLNYKSKRPISFVWAWLLVLGGSYFVHAAPSEAYFPAFFVPLSLLVGWSISQIKYPPFQQVLLISVAGLIVFNSALFIKSKGLSVSLPNTTHVTLAWLPRYQDQLNAIEFIRANTNAPIRLKTIDPQGKFPAYLDNYRFIAHYLNVPLSDDGATVWIDKLSSGKNNPPINSKIYEMDQLIISLPL